MMESTCIYLIDHGKWLLMYRNRKPDDINEGKWIGVGGKSLPGETPEECAVREFREETGMSITDFMMQSKLRDAKRLLRHSNKTLAQISSYLCFSSQAYFQTVFKRETGMTPAAYRKKAHKL